MTGHVFALAMAALDEANGPEGRPRKQDAPAEWDKIDWRAQEGRVRRLRQRIFKAAQEQDCTSTCNALAACLSRVPR
jgi:RNA-directed DNA polymerase